MIDEDDPKTPAPAPATGEPAGDEKESTSEPPEGEEPEGDDAETTEQQDKRTKSVSTDDDDDASDGDDDEDEDDEGDGEEPDKPKRRNTRGERYKRAISDLRRVQAENEALRRRSPGSLPSDQAALQRAITNRVEQQIGPPPNPDEYKNDYIGYERELTAYTTEKRLVTRQVKDQFTQAVHESQRRQTELKQDHEERERAFRKQMPNYDEVLAKCQVPAADHVKELILESRKSPNLCVYLATNPRTLERLNDMSERDAAREMGRIEARMSLPKPKTQTQARKPVMPLKGGAAPPASEAAQVNAALKKLYGDRYRP